MKLACNACAWQGNKSKSRMCGGIGPLCPECGETTESIADRKREAWDTYGTGVKPWSHRVPPVSRPTVIADAMQEELNELIPLILAYMEAAEDHRRLVRKLDVALNGEDGAAKQASLCDIVRQVQAEGIKSRPASPAGHADTERLDFLIENDAMIYGEPGNYIVAQPNRPGLFGAGIHKTARAAIDAGIYKINYEGKAAK